MSQNFSNHITGLLDRYQQVFEESHSHGYPIDHLLIHSGSEQIYFADDQAIPFRPFGHFSHWLPVSRPDQILLISPACRPVYFQVVPADYWYDQTIENSHWWSNEFDIVTLTNSLQLQDHLDKRIGRTAGLVYIGENEEFAENIGIRPDQVNPTRLLQALDYYRAYKSDYEAQQIAAANCLAMKGHLAASGCFLSGGSEFEVHAEFLQACNIQEEQSPYTNIVAINEKSAILHYQYKRHHAPNHANNKNLVLLIDAGCKINHYCSDITRTSLHPDCHTVFQSLLKQMNILQLRLVDLVRPGLSYIDFHRKALEFLSQTLIDHNIATCSLSQSIEQSLASLFMPHGIGHLLGIQVHDVGGKIDVPLGKSTPPPKDFPHLRNIRTMEQSMIFTVEPGLYFIPMLLDNVRHTPQGKSLNWKLIDELIPLGGIRIEDNVRVTKAGHENLTRQFETT
jgi:Xaa-Pro dipeptidase